MVVIDTNQTSSNKFRSMSMDLACTWKEAPMYSVLLFIHTLVGGDT